MEHSKEFVDLVESIRPNVREISVDEAQERVKNGAVLIDAREDNEWNEAHAAGAIHLGRGVIERDIVHQFPDKETEFSLLRRRLSLGSRGRQCAKNGLQKRLFNDWRLAGVAGGKRTD